MCGLPAFLNGLYKGVIRMINKQALDEAIYEKYIRPIQRPRRLYAGLEFELPIVNLEHKPVDFSVIYALTDAFISRFGFDEIHRDDDGNIYSAVRTADGDGLSYAAASTRLNFPLVWKRI